MDETTASGAEVVLRPAAELDAYTTPAFLAEFALALGSAARPAVVVDLAGVTFVDSTGLSALIDVRRQADEAGCQLRLRRPQSQLLRLMSMTQTYQLFRWL